MSLIYYNAAYTNAENAERAALIKETRNNAILEKPGEWEASIVRFDVSTNSIPLAIIKQTGVIPASATDCFVTLNYFGVNYTQNVLLTKSQTTNFNFIYNYQHWLDNINTALGLAFAALVGPPANQLPPQFILDPVTSLIRLYVSSAFISTAVNPINININAPLRKYLNGFQAFFNGYGTPLQKDYDILMNPSNMIVLPAAGAREGYPTSVAAANYTMYAEQESVSLGSWNSTRSLIITSEGLSTRPEFVQADIKSNVAYGISSSFQPILTDFIQDQSGGPAKRGVTVYLPTAEYRMMDMFGDVGLYSVDFRLSWTDFDGNVYPVMLGPGETFGVKLMFRRR